MNNRQEKPPLKCLLGIDPEKTQKCKPSECASCGWEAAEAARRREYVKEHGLTLCADGFRRLIIRKENDMATPYTTKAARIGTAARSVNHGGAGEPPAALQRGRD